MAWNLQWKLVEIYVEVLSFDAGVAQAHCDDVCYPIYMTDPLKKMEKYRAINLCCR